MRMNTTMRTMGMWVNVVLVMLAATACSSGADKSIPLAGEWAFKLDPGKVGVDEKWFAGNLPERVRLPGSTDENSKGEKNTKQPDFDGLSRVFVYVGPAWYQRDVEAPEAWKGKRITLSLERCHWETRLWVDGQAMGFQDSLCVPHEYDLSAALTPGRHKLTLRVDNSHKYNMGPDAHSTSEQTQTNWNGIVGKMELRATDPVWLDDVQIYPDTQKRTARVRIAIGNATGKGYEGALGVKVFTLDGKEVLAMEAVKFAASAQRVEREYVLPIQDAIRLWDEFDPALYDWRLSLTSQANGAVYSDTRTIRTGLRSLGVADGKQFSVNGRRIFLRGTLDCCIYPLTGYPPTDVEGWLRIIKIAKSYGLNHMRFHSWCPPEAAFAAADQLGFLFHVEAPQWVHDVGKDAKRDQFIEEEVRRILDTYGNHPSFGMLCMGNELNGEMSFLSKLVKFGQGHDPRHLYTSSTGWSFVPENDFTVAMVRGLRGPGTDHDFRDGDAKLKGPVVSHEIAQWTVYPNMGEIKKYTGVTRAHNFELIRDDLARRNMLDQARDFTLATGKLMVQLYKEEMEVLFRTPGHGGFQLLDLHDFPGQGTALVGALDAFWDSKGLIEPEQWRRFCSPSVPLLRMKKRVYTADEAFTAAAEIAHFGPADMNSATAVWTIKDEQGREVAGGTLPVRTLPTGKLLPLGNIEASLAKAEAPAKLTVSLAIKGTDIINDWEIWVYPAAKDVPVPAEVMVSRQWDDATKAALAVGRRVMLQVSARDLAGSVPGSFTPVFWSPVWFKGGAGTMSILCQPKHPALAKFPTEMHTNWQWYDLLRRSRTMILDETPANFRPIVQMIDNFSRNHKLGSLFEARVGNGRLLVCSIDLHSDMDQRPEARQLLRSLLSYAASEEFRPGQELGGAFLDKLFGGSAMTKMMEEPGATENAVLRVKAAGNVTELSKSEPWKKEADQVLASQEGFGYSVRGGTWKDNVGSTWHSQDDLAVTITCPKGFTGKLYAHFHDWNNLNRVAEVFFQARNIGTLDSYAGAGVWLAFPVTAADSEKGKLVLSARPTHANAHMTQIVLVKQ